MADLKISQLTGATTPLAGTEVLPVVQSSTTKKVSVANLTAGRVVEVAQLNLISGDTTAEILLKDTGTTNYYVRVKSRNNTMELVSGNGVTATLDASNNIKFESGNLTQGTAAKGVNFNANTPAAGMTSQLLNWYEEGTWTPSIGGNATYDNRSGYYTRIGRQVTAFFLVQVNVKGTGSADTVSGLPFTVSSSTTIRGGGSIQYFGSVAVNTAWLSPVANSNTTTFSFIGQNAVDDTCLDAIALFQDGTFVIGSIVYFV